MGHSRGPQCHGQGGTWGEPGRLRAKGAAKGAARKGLREGVSRGQSRSTALSGSGEGRGARSAGLTAQPEREQVNRSVWSREATPGHPSKLEGRSGRRTRDTNKATRERASGHPHPVTPPAPQQPRSRPGRASLLGPPPTLDCRPQTRAATSARSRAQLTSAGHRPGQLSSLQWPRPCPPPARPLHCAASRAAAFAPTWPACPPSPGHCAHVRGRGHNPARIPPPGKGARRAARSQSAREPGRRGDTPPATRAHGSRAPQPRARARARSTNPAWQYTVGAQ